MVPTGILLHLETRNWHGYSKRAYKFCV